MGKRRQLTKAVAAKGKTGKFRAAAKHAKGSTNNPFEVQKNKASKHTVLGRRVQGANRNVAMARSKAVERRKGSLLADMQGALKANKFVDKRWGEDDNAITEEDKMTMRLKLVHQKRKTNGCRYRRAHGAAALPVLPPVLDNGRSPPVYYVSEFQGRTYK